MKNKKLLLSLCIPAFFTSVAATTNAYAIEYQCSNKALVSKCHNDPNDKECLKPDAMTELLEFTLRSKSDFTSISQFAAIMKQLNGDLKENFYKHNNFDPAQWYPHEGELVISYWNGKQQDKTFQTVAHNFLPPETGTFRHSFFHSKDGINIYGDVGEDKIMKFRLFDFYVKQQDAPSGEWIFVVSGTCERIGKSPFPDRTSKKSDANKLFE